VSFPGKKTFIKDFFSLSLSLSLSGFDCFPLEMLGVEGKYKKKSLLVHDQKLQTMIEKSQLHPFNSESSLPSKHIYCLETIKPFREVSVSRKRRNLVENKCITKE
jgi:hypothetical protein